MTQGSLEALEKVEIMPKRLRTKRDTRDLNEALNRIKLRQKEKVKEVK